MFAELLNEHKGSTLVKLSDNSEFGYLLKMAYFLDFYGFDSGNGDIEYQNCIREN